MAATQVLPRPKAYDDTFFKPITLWLTTTDHELIGIMYYFWFPKITGRMLNEKLGEWKLLDRVHRLQRHIPDHAHARPEGMPRRIATYTNPAWARTNDARADGTLCPSSRC